MNQLSGKQLSLQAKIVAAVWTIVMTVLAGAFRWQITTWEIIQVGIFLALVFSAVDVSMVAKNLGKKPE